MTRIVGIDLGTTNSLVAFCDDRGPRVLLDEKGRALLPSVVRYRLDGAPIVGWDARGGRVEHAGATITSVKRLMGRSFDETQQADDRAAYAVVPGPRGMACVAPADAAGRTIASPDGAITPQRVSAEILGALKARAEAVLGESVSRAVVTVPAYFDDAQRQATRDAGRLAGLEVVRIVNEPTAAALAYGLGRRSREPETIAVYDLGGGTFDVSILRVLPGALPSDEPHAPEAGPSVGGGVEGDATPPGGADFFQVLATAGDTNLGGDDFDRLLAAELRARLEAASATGAGERGTTAGNLFNAGAGVGADASASARESGSIAELLQAAERAKIALSVDERADISLGASFSTVIDRAEFEALIAPLVQRTIDCCRRAMRDAQLSPEEIDRVVLVGGSSRVPAVRRAVEACFGREPYTALDPDQVVALGAAVQASIIAGTSRDLLLLDVIPLSLGIETVGGAVAKLIVRNTAIPARAAERFSTSVDGQSSVKIHVVQGERELVRDGRSLGEFHLRGIPPMPAGIPQIEVEFLVDANGILNVSAVERRSGKRAAIQVVPAYGLTREEVERMASESVLHAREDMRAHRVIDLVVNAQLDVKWIGDALRRVRAMLEPEYATALDARLAEVGGYIESARRDPNSVDANAFQRAKQALDEASVRMHEIAISASLRGAQTRDASL